jgi:hypothetical protein
MKPGMETIFLQGCEGGLVGGIWSGQVYVARSKNAVVSGTARILLVAHTSKETS